MKVLARILGVVAVFVVIYGAYWITKNVSYALFYKDMVRQTVVEMVKPESLK